MFAEIAAVDRIGRVARVGEFLGLDDADGEREFLRDFQRFLKLPARQAGRIGNHRQGAITQDLVSHLGEKHRIHAAGIGDETGAVALQQAPQFLQLVIFFCVQLSSFSLWMTDS